MAKKGKVGSKTAKKPKQRANELPDDPVARAEAELVTAVDEAMERGSYAGVRKLAQRLPAGASPETKTAIEARVARTTLDPGALAVAAFAILCVLVVGFITLV